MTPASPEDVRKFLTEYLGPRLNGYSKTGLPMDCDLLLSGMIDSLGLLQLVTALAERFNPTMDFDSLDPEKMTIVGPLCQFVAEQTGKG